MWCHLWSLKSALDHHPRLIMLNLSQDGRCLETQSVTASPQSSATDAPADQYIKACSWVPILQVGGLGKVRVNCFHKAIAPWHGRESNPRSPDLESDALTTPPRCPYSYFNSGTYRLDVV
ncbi:hypothetical protein ElyMa_006004000 [Elysia marginata]|uniref:Uncharacterized protein n=1 Tax=Elysia marginata TaxID=1093978 RepID=A0AAV4GGZ3_9GAST|nr:hypothetical protein ElyMa_006004000 [Elysia marginata]